MVAPLSTRLRVAVWASLALVLSLGAMPYGQIRRARDHRG